jgi:hypothetical protein
MVNVSNFGKKGNPIALTVDMDPTGAIKNIKKLTKSIAGIGLAGGASVLGLGALTGAMGALTGAASRHAAKLELVQNKTKIVFGDQLPLVQRWSAETASSFGLTAINLEGMAAGFQDLLIPMGFARDEAAQMTMDVVGLAGAMSEWSAGAFGRLVEKITDEVIPKIESDLFPVLQDLAKEFSEFLPTAINAFLTSVNVAQGGFERIQFAAREADERIQEYKKDLEVAMEDPGFFVQQDALSLLLFELADAFGLSTEKLIDLSAAEGEHHKLMQTTEFMIAKRLINLFEEAFQADKTARAIDELNAAYDREQEEQSIAALGAVLFTEKIEDVGDAASDAKEEVKKLSNQLTRLTAEQYATAVASEILHSSVSDQIQFDEMYDRAVKNLKKLIDSESQLAALKRQLMKEAGFDDFEFITTDKNGKTGSGESDSTFEGFVTGNFAGIPHAQVQKLKESAIKMDEVAQGMAHFALDLDAFMEPIAGAGTNLGTIGRTARFPKANEMMPGTPNAIANAIDDLFVGIVEEFNLPEHAAQSLAESMMKQATQQEIFQFGPALRGNLPGATSAGLPDPTIDPAGFAAAAPKEQVPVPKVDVTINAGIVPDMQEAGNLVAEALTQSDLYRSGAVTLGG